MTSGQGETLNKGSTGSSTAAVRRAPGQQQQQQRGAASAVDHTAATVAEGSKLPPLVLENLPNKENTAALVVIFTFTFAWIVYCRAAERRRVEDRRRRLRGIPDTAALSTNPQQSQASSSSSNNSSNSSSGGSSLASSSSSPTPSFTPSSAASALAAAVPSVFTSHSNPQSKPGSSTAISSTRVYRLVQRCCARGMQIIRPADDSSEQSSANRSKSAQEGRDATLNGSSTNADDVQSQDTYPSPNNLNPRTSCSPTPTPSSSTPRRSSTSNTKSTPASSALNPTRNRQASNTSRANTPLKKGKEASSGSSGKQNSSSSGHRAANSDETTSADQRDERGGSQPRPTRSIGIQTSPLMSDENEENRERVEDANGSDTVNVSTASTSIDADTETSGSTSQTTTSPKRPTFKTYSPISPLAGLTLVGTSTPQNLGSGSSKNHRKHRTETVQQKAVPGLKLPSTQSQSSNSIEHTLSAPSVAARTPASSAGGRDCHVASSPSTRKTSNPADAQNLTQNSPSTSSSSRFDSREGSVSNRSSSIPHSTTHLSGIDLTGITNHGIPVTSVLGTLNTPSPSRATTAGSGEGLASPLNGFESPGSMTKDGDTQQRGDTPNGSLQYCFHTSFRDSSSTGNQHLEGGGRDIHNASPLHSPTVPQHPLRPVPTKSEPPLPNVPYQTPARSGQSQVQATKPEPRQGVDQNNPTAARNGISAPPSPAGSLTFPSLPLPTPSGSSSTHSSSPRLTSRSDSLRFTKLNPSHEGLSSPTNGNAASYGPHMADYQRQMNWLNSVHIMQAQLQAQAAHHQAHLQAQAQYLAGQHQAAASLHGMTSLNSPSPLMPSPGGFAGLQSPLPGISQSHLSLAQMQHASVYPNYAYGRTPSPLPYPLPSNMRRASTGPYLHPAQGMDPSQALQQLDPSPMTQPSSPMSSVGTATSGPKRRQSSATSVSTSYAFPDMSLTGSPPPPYLSNAGRRKSSRKYSTPLIGQFPASHPETVTSPLMVPADDTSSVVGVEPVPFGDNMVLPPQAYGQPARSPVSSTGMPQGPAKKQSHFHSLGLPPANGSLSYPSPSPRRSNSSNPAHQEDSSSVSEGRERKEAAATSLKPHLDVLKRLDNDEELTEAELRVKLKSLEAVLERRGKELEISKWRLKCVEVDSRSIEIEHQKALTHFFERAERAEARIKLLESNAAATSAISPAAPATESAEASGVELEASFSADDKPPTTVNGSAENRVASAPLSAESSSTGPAKFVQEGTSSPEQSSQSLLSVAYITPTPPSTAEFPSSPSYMYSPTSISALKYHPQYPPHPFQENTSRHASRSGRKGRRPRKGEKAGTPTLDRYSTGRRRSYPTGSMATNGHDSGAEDLAEDSDDDLEVILDSSSYTYSRSPSLGSHPVRCRASSGNTSFEGSSSDHDSRDLSFTSIAPAGLGVSIDLSMTSSNSEINEEAEGGSRPTRKSSANYVGFLPSFTLSRPPTSPGEAPTHDEQGEEAVSSKIDENKASEQSPPDDVDSES